MLLGMLLTVAAILALAYFTTRFLAGVRLKQRVRVHGSEHDNMCLLDQMILGTDERLVLVQVGERCLLLGVTPSGINTLAELTEEEAARWTAERDGEAGVQTPPPSFRDALTQVLSRKKK